MYCVVQENNNPYLKGGLPNFIDKPVSCASLNVNYYEANCHTDLQKSIEAFKVHMKKSSGIVSYNTSANNLITAVSEFTLYVSRNRNFIAVNTTQSESRSPLVLVT